MSDTFILSIEPTEGETYQYGFHLGTIESTARDCAIDIFKNYSRKGIRPRTVALRRDGFFDVYDGTWSSENKRVIAMEQREEIVAAIKDAARSENWDEVRNILNELAPINAI